jgi:hypothetical protein
MKIIISIAILLFANSLSAQIADTIAPFPSDTVTLKIFKDSRIDVLTSKKIYIAPAKRGNEGPKSEKIRVSRTSNLVTMQGFRLQLLNSTNRPEVYSKKGMLAARYPTIKSYVLHQAPFFKLRFGNFTSRAEAEKYKKMLSSLFPAGIYIVNDTIEVYVQKTTPSTSEEDK